MKTLQSIFEKNGYPGPIVSRVIQQTVESEPMRTGEQTKVDKVFIRLPWPWLGPKSAAFTNRIHRATIEALPDCKAVTISDSLYAETHQCFLAKSILELKTREKQENCRDFKSTSPEVHK